MSAARMSAVGFAALVCGAATFALVLSSSHPDADAGWARLSPVVGLSFIATGLYAWRRRPDSRIGALMVYMGFAWFLQALALVNSPALYTLSLVVGGLWGGVFLHLVLSFPTGRLAPGWDRGLAIAGYLIFTLGSVPALLFAGPDELGCDECPANVLQVRHDPELASAFQAVEATLYAVLFILVLVRLALRRRRTGTLERLQLTPVYVCGLLTFLVVTAATGGAGAGARWWRSLRPRCSRSRSWRACCAATWQGWSRSCARRAPGSSPRPTPSAGGSSETSTTAPRRDWSRSRCCSVTPAQRRKPIPPRCRRCSTRRWPR